MTRNILAQQRLRTMRMALGQVGISDTQCLVTTGAKAAALWSNHRQAEHKKSAYDFASTILSYCRLHSLQVTLS